MEKIDNMSAMPDSFSAILDPIELRTDGPFEIVPGIHLRRATDEEIELIRSENRRNDNSGHYVNAIPYEIDWVPTDNPGGATTIPIPRERWRYAVVSFTAGDRDIRNVELCLAIMSPSLQFGVTFYRDLGGRASMGAVGVHPPSYHSFLMDDRGQEAIKTVTTETLMSLRACYAALVHNREEQPVVIRSLESFHNLKSLPRRSDASILLSFALIESLITHKPRLHESLDSIKHQVRTKMVLLNKEFSKPIRHEISFPQLNENKLWSLLYDFRSAIAHGQQMNMTGTFANLRSRELVAEYVEEVTKALIVLGLIRPQFLADLREI